MISFAIIFLLFQALNRARTFLFRTGFERLKMVLSSKAIFEMFLFYSKWLAP